jgi:hypothetical protein
MEAMRRGYNLHVYNNNFSLLLFAEGYGTLQCAHTMDDGTEVAEEASVAAERAAAPRRLFKVSAEFFSSCSSRSKQPGV